MIKIINIDKNNIFWMFSLYVLSTNHTFIISCAFYFSYFNHLWLIFQYIFKIKRKNWLIKNFIIYAHVHIVWLNSLCLECLLIFTSNNSKSERRIKTIVSKTNEYNNWIKYRWISNKIKGKSIINHRYFWN